MDADGYVLFFGPTITSKYDPSDVLTLSFAITPVLFVVAQPQYIKIDFLKRLSPYV